MMKQVMLFLLLGAGCSSPSSASNPPSRATAPEPVETAESAKPDPNTADLAAIKAWTEAWQAAGAAGVHPAQPAVCYDD